MAEKTVKVVVEPQLSSKHELTISLLTAIAGFMVGGLITKGYVRGLHEVRARRSSAPSE